MKQFKPEQARWIWSCLIIGVILMGIYLILSLPPSGFEKFEEVAQTTKSLPEEKQEPPPMKKTAFITPKEMEEFISSLRKNTSLRDPFLGSGEKEWKTFLDELKERPPQLKGIIQVEGNRIALIHNSRYREGDEVKGFKIIRIEDEYVVLNKGEKNYTIYLKK
ncbi:MAG: hypothetical protein DRG25_00215 [Deltaproteobacteria bacterium]|nr:MAG: hypothetical protein DRG25_00215 [Deltaproteobacteria bacterium]